MGRKRDDSGQYVETVGPDDVLDVFVAVEGPAVTSSDVAEHLECSTEAARQKLRRLVDEGLLARRKTGRTALYWRPGADESARESEPSGKVGGSPDTTLDADEEALDTQETPTVDEGLPEEKVHKQTAADRDLKRVVDDALDHNVDAALRAAVQACIEYLREHGRGEKSDFIDNVFPKHAAGYASPGGWWNLIGKEYLKAVADEYTPVSSPQKESGHTWKYDP